MNAEATVYECEACSDTGWQESRGCDGGDWSTGRSCGRKRRHLPHTYTVICPCREMNRTWQDAHKGATVAA